MVAFVVRGVPRPQGSTRSFVVGGRAVTTNRTPALDHWRTAIASAAQPRAKMLEGAVCVEAVFCLVRPKSHPVTKTKPAIKRPDIDRLARALLDALTGIAWGDDAQVTVLKVRKTYAQRGGPSGVAVRLGDPTDPAWDEPWPPDGWE